MKNYIEMTNNIVNNLNVILSGIKTGLLNKGISEADSNLIVHKALCAVVGYQSSYVMGYSPDEVAREIVFICNRGKQMASEDSFRKSKLN